MPTFEETVEIGRGWGDWLVLRQVRDTQGGRFIVHNPWGDSTQAQGAADRNRLELGYRFSNGVSRWAQVVVHGPTGNVGLGLGNPRTPLHVLGRIGTGLDHASAGAVTFFPPDGFAWFHIDNGPGARPIGRLRISHGPNPGDNELVSILQDGRVGIGTANPRERLEVNGSIAVTGDVQLLGADCAERFTASEASAGAEPGTVMVLGEEGALRASDGPYDRKVIGVVSGAGDYRPGLVLDSGQDGEGEVRLDIALIGKVFCKVDAAPAAVEIGDLLTTAERPGHAMKATDPGRAFGAVIGKALAPLEAGEGLVPILVALQ
jgi:hypothetical protein